MVFLKRVFEKKPHEKALEREAEQAKWEGFRSGRLAKARAEGRAEGRGTKRSGFMGALESISLAAEQGERLLGLGDLGGNLDLGLGPAPRRKASHRKKPKRKR